MRPNTLSCVIKLTLKSEPPSQSRTMPLVCTLRNGWKRRCSRRDSHKQFETTAPQEGWSEVGVLHGASYWHSMNFTRAGTNWKSIPRAILFFMRAATELFSRPCCSILATLGPSQNAGRSQHQRYRCEAACPVGVAKLTSTRMIYGFDEGSIRRGTYYSCQ